MICRVCECVAGSEASRRACPLPRPQGGPMREGETDTGWSIVDYDGWGLRRLCYADGRAP